MTAPAAVRPAEYTPVVRSESDPSRIPFRIRIGVSGGREVAALEGLAARIFEVIDQHVPGLFDAESRKLIDEASHTPLAFAIVTSLGDSAERFVANVIAGRPAVRLDVVLPFGEEVCRRELSSDAARKEFDTLFAQARRPVRLREGLPSSSRAEAAAAREEACEELAWYLVDHCDVVLALADGRPLDDEGRSPALLACARAKGRPIITVSTVDPFRVSIERGHGLSARSITRLEMLNTWPVPAKEMAAYAASVERQLFDNPQGRAIPGEARATVREQIIPHYVRASTIAKYYQRLHLRAGLAVYVLSSLAVALVALGVVVRAFAPVAAAVELALLVTALLIVRRAHRERTHTKWIESRFLSERLRHAMFLAACGVEAARLRIPPYMGRADQPDEWMVRAFDEIWSRLPILEGCRGRACAPLAEFVGTAWVTEQRKFHENKAAQTERISHRLERVGVLVLVLAIAAALGELLLLVRTPAVPSIEGVLKFAAIVLPAVGAAIGGYRAHREYTRLARRSRNMAAALSDLEERLKRVRSPGALESVLRTTEDWMLRETQDWLLLMHTTKLETVC